ncbi:hypothetical protein BN14_00002 [Rhizoctonia solani AG-1 IB]|nr:hypothetical protein BN14_00002 [Rhizoctonia solani AG-1 IB]
MEARKAGLHPNAIQDACCRSGQFPLDPNIFGEEDYAPSTVSSISVHLPPSFPLLPAPVALVAPAPPESRAENLQPDLPPAEGCATTAEWVPEVINSTEAGLSHHKQPARGDYIQDRRELPLKQQVRGFQDDIEAVWELASGLWDQLGRTNAHTALLQAENGELRRQIQAQTKPRRTQDEATAASQVQKHGFLTNPEYEAAFQARLAELHEKRAADERKATEKESRTREIEGRRSRMIADPNHTFTAALQSYKTANLEQLGDLAASLALPFLGLKKADIFNNITKHFDAHPELKIHPRFSSLFRISRPPRQEVPVAGSSHVNLAPAMVAEYALPPQL